MSEYEDKTDKILFDKSLSTKQKGLLIYKLHKRYYKTIDYKQQKLDIDEFSYLIKMRPDIN